MISDFESGKGDMIQQGGRTGYWYVYFPGSGTATSPASPMSMTPVAVNGAPISLNDAAGCGGCDGSHALQVQGSGFTGATDGYAGFGAFFKPAVPFLQNPTTSSPNKNGTYDVSSYSGVTFKMKSGSGTPPAIFFEMLTQENQPSIQGGNLNPANPGPDANIGLHNTRGWLINTPWTPTAISSSWQTVTVPFAYLVPRHLTDSATCTSSASATAICQPPAFVPTDVLGIQVSFYDATSTNGSGFPTPSGSTPGTFDIWIDDVAFTTGDSGLQTISGFPLTNAGSMGSCKLPTGPAASAKYLVPAYNQWKANFVKGNRVIRPEAANDTVSEGQAYGMLIAVNMNDKTLFDSLYSGWTGSPQASGSTLMTWCLGSSGGGTGTACTPSGGSATDADEDAAFALLQAATVFNDTSYKTKAMAMIAEIYSKDIDPSTHLPTGGSNYNNSSATTNPSYFAPAYYNAFKAAGDTNDWASVNTAIYNVVNASTWTNGLLPAWCSGNTCTAPGSNPGSADPATDGIYQYDAHRIPMRIGLDYCFNGTAAAKTYTAKTTTFFATNANAGLYGIGRIFDMYQLNGTAAANAANNSASIIGTAAVGAMADGSNQSFINTAYQEVFDLVTRSSMSTIPPAKTPYSYYNATVGMLTLLMMTGNFSH